MGAWGIKTFENDKALDWLGSFLNEPSERKLIETFSITPPVIQPGLIGRLFGKSAVSLPVELEGEQILAAAEVIATILGKPSPNNPDDLDDLPPLDLSRTAAVEALAAIDEMRRNSNLKDCWEDSDDFQEWITNVDDLRSRLRMVA